MRGRRIKTLDGFPADRVIADDMPMYVYYKWFWKKGDGWNGLEHRPASRSEDRRRDDFWTYHDPAVRVASVYGSGGEVDFLSHWTYSYPDPIRIGLCHRRTVLHGRRILPADQQVMKMTQIIWYRSQTAPEPGEEADPTRRFSDHDMRPSAPAPWTLPAATAAGSASPDARFITIAPMHLREAFWTKIARPIKGIMYHGWQSLVKVKDGHSSYRYTHPQTRHELRAGEERC